MTEVRPDIAIVTVGAHIQTKDMSYTAIIDQVLSEMLELKREMPEMTFAWKTQAPAGSTKEISSPTNAAEAAYNQNFNDPNQKSYYNWGRFYQRDMLLLSRLQTIQMPYLDVRMLYSRTDAHPGSIVSGSDSLHFLSPGPLDVMGRLFHQFLVNIDGRVGTDMLI